MLKISKKNILFSFIAAIAIILLAFGVWSYQLMFAPNFNIDNVSYVYISPSTTFETLCEQLSDSAHCKNIKSFKRLATFMNYPENMKTGRYKIKPGMDNFMLINDLRKKHQSPVRFTFNNIRLKEDLAHRIGEQLMLEPDSLISFMNDSSSCASMGFTPQTIVSMFIPNTYEVYWDMSEESFLKRMKKEYDSFWNEKRRKKASEMNMTPQEIATLASIVEEESANRAEYPIIAGLYINRLKRGIPLQADPTVKFAVGDFSLKRIMHEHLEIESPYNTYKYAGLPPGPLRVPSSSTIDAVLNYTNHTYLYMCAKEDFSGSHNFASTLEQHSRNAQRYRAALNRNGIR